MRGYESLSVHDTWQWDIRPHVSVSGDLPEVTSSPHSRNKSQNTTSYNFASEYVLISITNLCSILTYSSFFLKVFVGKQEIIELSLHFNGWGLISSYFNFENYNKWEPIKSQVEVSWVIRCHLRTNTESRSHPSQESPHLLLIQNNKVSVTH